MKSAIALITLLAAAGSAVAQNCAAVPTYTQALQLSCQGNEMNFNWPNYQNASEFYACQGQGRPLLLNCASGTYFSYVLQSCLSCADYIPSQPCNTLQISKTSSCVNIGATTTTAAPTTTTTAKTPAVTTTTTKAPAVTTTTTKAPVTTTTTPGPVSTAFPPAPSPVTVDPDIPTPPTAAPTPPPVEVKPPTVVIPN